MPLQFVSRGPMALPAGVAPMNPLTDITGLFWSFDAQTISKLFQQQDGATAVTTTGDPVGWITNYHTTTYCVHASGTADRGVYNSTTLNGLPGVICSTASSTALYNVVGISALNTANFTISFIFRPDSGTSSNCHFSLIGSTINDLEYENPRSFGIYYNGTNQRYGVSHNNTGVNTSNGVAIIGDVYHLALTFNGTTGNLYFNGASVGTFAQGGNLATDRTVMAPAAAYGYGGAQDVTFGEGYAATSCLTSDQIASLHAYYLTRWTLG